MRIGVLGILAFWTIGASPLCSLAERVTLSYAENFSIEKRDTHTLITVRNPWRGSGRMQFRYALAPRGRDVPSNLEGARLIRVPVTRLSLMETVYLSHLNALDAYGSLVGLAHPELASDLETRRRVESGEVKTIPAKGNLDVESLILLQSEAIFTSAMGNPQFDVHPQLERANQPVVVTAEYMEAHPLGRSEWLKFTAAFLGKEKEADALFKTIEDRYLELRSLARNPENRPTVLANAPFGGVWHVPGGRSFTAEAIADAGGRYVFSDDESNGGVPKDFESVYFRAAEADIWLHPGTARTMDELLEMDPRFARFAASRKGGVYNNTRLWGPGGRNAIWERGILHPEETLADLIAILHPELLPNHVFVYYERLQ